MYQNQNKKDKNVLQITSDFMWKTATVILSYYTLGPAYYLILDSLYTTAMVDAGGDLLTFLSVFKPIFDYSWATYHVLALIFLVVGFTKKLREKYYATQEVRYYGY